LPVSNVAERDSARRGDVDVLGDIGDGVFSYVQEIAQTPQLTRKEERKLFEAFSASTQEISELLRKLPPQILDDLQSQSVLGRGNKTKSLNGRWWSPMEIRAILERISTVFETVQNSRIEANPGEKDAIQTIWNQLVIAVAAMEAVRKQIVCANLLLVASVVMQYRSYTPSLSLLDLMQEGSIGLMKAVEKFDLQRGCKFSTYAYWWIRQGIQRALAQQSHTIRIPDYIGSTRQSITKTEARLARELEREPSIRETALAMGIDEGRVVEILQAAKGTISLSSPFFDLTDTTFSDMLADDSHVTPEEELLCIGKRESLEKVLDTLTPREKLVIQLRYGLTDGTEHTLAEVGQQLGISRERVRQIQEEALRKLRQTSRSQSLKELL
jgi:RNA polymerase sigma factor (sigma-70 family)